MPTRLLIIADTHGYLDAARRAIVDEGPWDHVIHLGDSMLDAVGLSAELGIDVVAVRGNDEFDDSPDYEDVLVFEAGGVRFRATHGHELDFDPVGVDCERKIEELAIRARASGSRVALFGHTHVALAREVEGVLVFNPGAMGPGDGRRAHGRIEVEGGEVLLAEIVEVQV